MDIPLRNSVSASALSDQCQQWFTRCKISSAPCSAFCPRCRTAPPWNGSGGHRTYVVLIDFKCSSFWSIIWILTWRYFHVAIGAHYWRNRAVACLPMFCRCLDWAGSWITSAPSARKERDCAANPLWNSCRRILWHRHGSAILALVFGRRFPAFIYGRGGHICQSE